MSNVAEKQNRVEELKKARAEILDASTADMMLLRMVNLKMVLSEMESTATGEVKRVVQRTLEELNRVMMYDATRSEVCKWVQTLICELSTQK